MAPDKTGKRAGKARLDTLLVDRGISPSRERARALILAGSVIVGGETVSKAGAMFAPDAEISIRGGDNPYVSRGGLKLRGALEAFRLDVAGMTAIDVGASTGGFTDCLLQAGAAKVYAVDVGYGQLAWKLRQDPRVVNLERTNIRYFNGSGITDPLDIAVIDASFISLKLVVPAVIRLIGKEALVLALIKPQFEAGREEVGKKGVVKDPAVHARVVAGMEAFFRSLALDVKGVIESPLLGPEGNREFFIFAKKTWAE
jgi:23S rRNA (cytidine1920-2'-O)/16S rRNA (cytidine1409-2'-O)-methyltransferase